MACVQAADVIDTPDQLVFGFGGVRMQDLFGDLEYLVEVDFRFDLRV